MGSIIDKASKNKLIKDQILVRNDDKKQKFIDTGCLSLNVLFSGRLNGGIPVGKISQIAAPSSLGKTFIGLKVAKSAQRMGMETVYLDTEFAYDFEFARNLGIDDASILPIQDNRIERVQSKLLSLVDALTAEEKEKTLIIIDSWGNLVTSKTEEDAMSGNDKRDMTAQQKKNSFARLLTGLGVTIFVVNHVYDCGAEDTQILTPDGPIKLKDLSVGDIVLSPYGEEEILNVFKYDNSILYDIELEDGTVLSFTENHKLLVRDESGENIWKSVGEMMPGDAIIEANEADKFDLKV